MCWLGTRETARSAARSARGVGKEFGRLGERGIQLPQASAHQAQDFCIYYENAIVNIGDEPHPVYPPISAINGGPSVHPNCVHVLTPFVERLATEEEREAGVISPEVLNRTPGELQQRYGLAGRRSTR